MFHGSETMTIDDRVARVIASKHYINIPHPTRPGMRVVGWLVDEDVAGLSEGLDVMEKITAKLTHPVAVL